MKSIIYFLTVLFPLLIIDGLWLFLVANKLYMPKINHLLGSPKIIPIILFYLLYAFGALVLLINPSLEKETTYFILFVKALIFGIVAYGTYDLTNQALLKDWPALITIIDIIWGGLLTGVVAVISKYLINIFKI